MTEIRNLTFQPLTLHFAGSAMGFHLMPRETKAIAAEMVSEDMRAAQRRGFISIVDVSQETQPDPCVESAVDEHNTEHAGDMTRQRKKRER